MELWTGFADDGSGPIRLEYGMFVDHDRLEVDIALTNLSDLTMWPLT